MPGRSWLSRNKMLAKYPFAVKHIFRFRVSATDRFYFLFFSPLCSQFFLKFSLLRIPLNVQSVYLSHFCFHSTKQRKEPIQAFVLTVISILSAFVWAPTWRKPRIGSIAPTIGSLCLLISVGVKFNLIWQLTSLLTFHRETFVWKPFNTVQPIAA